MVSRREKLSRTYLRLREQTFHKQVAILSTPDYHKSASSAELNALREANHGPSIYDTIYSYGETTCQKEDFDQIVQLIAGLDSNTTETKKVSSSDSSDYVSVAYGVSSFAGQEWRRRTRPERQSLQADVHKRRRQ